MAVKDQVDHHARLVLAVTIVPDSCDDRKGDDLRAAVVITAAIESIITKMLMIHEKAPDIAHFVSPSSPCLLIIFLIEQKIYGFPLGSS